RNQAIRTVQFYLLWGILFINVTAGIGILAQASPMMQDLFQKTPLEAGVIVSLISVFNAGGRFLWASGSDYIGRRNTYTIFFVVQFLLFLLIPRLAATGNWPIFLASLFTVFTMYGGGFATIPAFLADIFGPENVSAIHGATLTAWSAAAVAGPVLITELSNRAKAHLGEGAGRFHPRPIQKKMPWASTSFAKGDYVLMAWEHPDKDARTGTPYSYFTYDVVRVKDGKIQEHWNSVRRMGPTGTPVQVEQQSGDHAIPGVPMQPGYDVSSIKYTP